MEISVCASKEGNTWTALKTVLALLQLGSSEKQRYVWSEFNEMKKTNQNFAVKNGNFFWQKLEITLIFGLQWCVLIWAKDNQ